MIPTEHLNLVKARPEMVRADLEGPAALADALGVGVPTSWPPDLYDDSARAFALKRLETAPEEADWWHYYVVECSPMPALAGIVGFKGPPDSEGTVEVGYSILHDRRGRGVATEAVAGLVEHAFGRPDVRRVAAETLPSLGPSISVLKKLGFTRIDSGPGYGEVDGEPIIRFVLERDAWERRAGKR